MKEDANGLFQALNGGVQRTTLKRIYLSIVNSSM